MSLAANVFAWRCRRAHRILQIEQRRRLEDELRTYASPRDRDELMALLAMVDDDQSAEVRAVVDRVDRVDRLDGVDRWPPAQRWARAAGMAPAVRPGW